MTSEHCDHSRRTDLTHGKSLVRNYYCHTCGSHWYLGRFWTEKQWDEYVEDFSEDNSKYFKMTVDKIEYNSTQVRLDILKNKESVPVGDGYYGEEQRLPYRWVNNDEDFQVYLDGKWQEAQSIDFQFNN